MAVEVKISGVTYVGVTDSVQITEQARATASTTIQVRLDDLPIPVSLQAVEILIDDVPVFAGHIENVDSPQYDTGFETRVVSLSIQSLEAILNRRLITRSWYNKYVHEIVQDIYTEYLAEEGLTIGSISVTTVQLDSYKKSYEQASSVLNDLAKRCDGASFYISPDKKFYFLVSEDFPQVDAPEHITGLKRVDAYGDLRTVQVMKGASSRIVGTATNATLLAEIAALSGTSGKIEKMESDGTIHNPTKAGTEATERLSQYAEREITLTCTCHDLTKTALYQTWAIYSGHFPTARQLPTGAALPGVSSVYPLDMTGLYTVVQRTITCYGPDQYKVTVTLKNRNFFARYGYSIRLALEDARRAGAAIDDIHSENQFTPNKKIEARAKWNAIAAEKDLLDDQADTYAIVEKKATYDAAFQALADYLNGGTAWVSGYPLWISGDELSETEEIDSDAFEGYWSGYDAGKADLSTSITAAAQAAAIAESLLAVPAYTPQYLGAKKDAIPTGGKEGDVYLLYSETPNTVTPPTVANPPDHRGVFRYTSSAWTWTTDPADMYKAIRDIVDVCRLRDNADPPAPLYGVEADYGVTSSIDVAHIKTALIDMLRVGDLTVAGIFNSDEIETIDTTVGETISAPAATHWAGSTLVSHCSGLADGETAVDATSSLGGKNVTKIYKGSDSTVYYQGYDTEKYASTYQYEEITTIVSTVQGKVKIYIDQKPANLMSTEIRCLLQKNSVNVAYTPISSSWESIIYNTETFGEINVEIGDSLRFLVQYHGYAKNIRISPATNTIGVFNDADNTSLVIDNAAYYAQTGNINLAGLADFAPTLTHWLGSVFINLFDGKVRPYVEQAVDSGTFPTSLSKTALSVYISGNDSIRITHTDAATTTILAASYYSYAGTVVLADIAGGLLVKGADPDGPYKFTNSKIDTGDPDDELYELILQNRYTDKPHTILTLKNPDPGTANHEATLSQLIESATRVILHDSALMDYDATKMFYRLKNFSDAEYLGWEWDTYARVAGVMTKFIAAYLDGAGIFQPKGGYKSVDGSTGATGSFVAGTKTVTVKNGIITAIV